MRGVTSQRIEHESYSEGNGELWKFLEPKREGNQTHVLVGNQRCGWRVAMVVYIYNPSTQEAEARGW
jgi:hypothetical protein